MALIHCDFYSEVLGLCTSMYVILPQESNTLIGMETKAAKAAKGKHPTLYLLHGLSDDHTIWLRRTSIERYVASLGIAVVMPDANRSFYSNMASGQKYWTFVSEELPAVARSFFPLSEKREDNFVAGLSMGGFGAFKLALNHPDRFAAAASLSGALDPASKIVKGIMDKQEYSNIFGNEEYIKESENDLFHLAKSLADSDGQKPKLFQCCGTEDFLYEDNERFRDYVKKLPLDFVYEEEEGMHEWGYWDRKIQRVLNWLPINGK